MNDKKYEKYLFQEIEKYSYNIWKKNRIFKLNKLNNKKFSMILPPPNITGKLHLGTCLGCNFTRYFNKIQKNEWI